MGKPVIGITTGRSGHGAPRDATQKVLTGCGTGYPACVERSGGAPVLLPRTGDGDVIESVMARLDGLLLSGGGDVVSLAYAEEPHPKAAHLDPVRDGMEFEAVRIATERGLPILGICRGVQLLNVALGGTLIQDIPSQVEGAMRHHTGEGRTVLAHAIEIEEGSLLADVLGVTSLRVNSRHHQAVRDVGRGLRVSARAPDGVVEGVEGIEGVQGIEAVEGVGGLEGPEGVGPAPPLGPRRPILAVQCHPEDLCEDDCEDHPIFRRLFDWLVEEAAKRLPDREGRA